MNQSPILPILLGLLFGLKLQAATLLLLDSGADHQNKVLKSHVRRNLLERANLKDDDHNGFIDDLLGWNFIEMNPRPFNSQLNGNFDERFHHYYEVRYLKTMGTASEAQLNWYKNIRKDEDFLKELKLFKSYIHASHVAGIAMTSKGHQFINVKYLGTAESGPAKPPEYQRRGNSFSTKQRHAHIKNFFNNYISWQVGKLKMGIDYGKDHAEVVNGSFGLGYDSICEIAKEAFEEEFQSDATEAWIKERAQNFAKTLLLKTTALIKTYPQILFVFSAGNSNENNDEIAHFPSDVRLKNVLAVGASLEFQDKAYFSNFGKRTVDIFAPGVGIKSTIPENKYLRNNGTSQAAPYVSGLALDLIQSAKEKLKMKISANGLKEIIVGTVDRKSGLKDLSVSGGIVNKKRAMLALSLSKTIGIKKAIKKSYSLVSDQNSTMSLTQPIIEADELLLP